MSARVFCIMTIGGIVAAGAVAAEEMTFTMEEVKGADACQSVAGIAVDQQMLCSCTPAAMSGSVWGTPAYTSDSSVCAAALHAGAVPPEGGAIVVTGSAGQTSYTGTTNNGITTQNWAAYGTSFGVAPAQIKTTLAACGQIPSGADTHTCHCPAAGGVTGRVWGYGPYTADSDICSAARHAGYIDGDGGDVTVLRLQGLQRYLGGESNGINTSDWQAYSSSIVFDWNAP
ncbi:MAG TPA: hypothetical protein DIT67_12840 [Octadecabacter sp.]|nr:hypothetical protein [Octadecabacter sp.]